MTAPLPKVSTGILPADSEYYTKAILNILEDFSEEKTHLEKTQRAFLNIMEDSATEKVNLEVIQRAVINILEDFSDEKVRLEQTQKAMLNLLEDFDRERVKTEAARRDLHKSNIQLRDEIEERNKIEERLKKSLEEKEVLLKEIHHRVKNNLQLIQSMLNLQLPQIKDGEAITQFKESQNRVYSIALIHEKLYQGGSLAKIDFSEYIRSLTNFIFLSYGITGGIIQLRISVEDTSLDMDTIIPCALIINELVSNSLKHAFPASKRSDEPAEIHIGLHVDVGNKLLLTVSDNGIGLPDGFEIQNCNSLGLKVVSVLARQLNGIIHISGNKGAEFKISFPTKNI